MSVTRRRFLTATGAAAVPLALAGCGFSPKKSPAKSASDTLTFTTWGTDAELAGFRKVIAGFEKANSGTKVTLNSVPYAQMFTDIDAQLQAGKAPDIFRVPYYTFGSYAGRGQLLDLSSQLPSGFGDRFTPAAWAAVQNKGKPFGVPHHTDTSVIVYNKDLFQAAGITSVPTSIDQAWTWAEFEQVAMKLRKALPAHQVPVRLQLAGQRGDPLAQLALRGQRPVPDARTCSIPPSTPRPDERRWTSPRASSRTSSCRRTARSSPRRLRGGHVVRADGRHDVQRRLRHPRRRADAQVRLGCHVLAAQRPLGRRLRRQRPGGHREDEQAQAGGGVPRLRHPGPADAGLLRRGVLAADPSRPGGEGYRLRRAPGAVPDLDRAGRIGPGRRLGSGGVAVDVEDHHRPAGPARERLRRWAEHGQDDQRQSPPASPPRRRSERTSAAPRSQSGRRAGRPRTLPPALRSWSSPARPRSGPGFPAPAGNR